MSNDQYNEKGAQAVHGGGGCNPCGCIALAVILGILVLGVLGLRISLKTIKVSWYNPALLGTNCASVRWEVEQTASGQRSVGRCVSTTASGMPWEQGLGWSAACAPRYPFGTVFFAGSVRPWICKDRGGAIRSLPGNKVWVDMLVKKPVYPFGTEVPGVFIWLEGPVWEWH